MVADFVDDQFSFVPNAHRPPDIRGREAEIEAAFDRIRKAPLGCLDSAAALGLLLYEMCGLPVEPGFYYWDEFVELKPLWVGKDSVEIQRNSIVPILMRVHGGNVYSISALGFKSGIRGVPHIASELLSLVEQCRTALDEDQKELAVHFAHALGRLVVSLELEMTQAKPLNSAHRMMRGAKAGGRMRASSPKREARDERIIQHAKRFLSRNRHLTKSAAIKSLQKPGAPGEGLSASSLYSILKKKLPASGQTGKPVD